MRPTEQLTQEHNGIKLMLNILGKACTAVDYGANLNVEHFEKILEFLKVFVGECHHSKEEELLFPAMEEAGIPNEGGPIGVMIAEHAMGRSYVKAMSEFFIQYKSGDKKAHLKISEEAKNYTELLFQHIDKEDNILYPMGDAKIPAQKQKELLQAFEKIEIERIGAGRHDEFHKTLHQLKGIYLE